MLKYPYPLHVVDILDKAGCAPYGWTGGKALRISDRMTSIGTRLFTLFKGKLIGRDAAGRAYYQERRAARPDQPWRRVRRWVIYRPGEDPSAVPAEWWNWLHYADQAPLPASVRKPWQLPASPNLTGQSSGYRPPGSDYRGGHRRKATGDYEAWSPEGNP